MDLHRSSIRNQMDYSADSKDAKSSGPTEDRVDSGLDSLKEEEYRAVADELTRLRVDCPRQQQQQQQPSPPVGAGQEQEWQTHVTEDGDTMLHLAVIHGAKDCIRTMINLSRNTHFLNTQNDQRQTSLHLAVVTDQPDVCERLLGAGGDPTLVDDSGDTALHIACRRGNLACFSVITQNCPSEQLNSVMSTCNYKGQNCLHLASVQGFLSLVESLVALGADVNAQEQCNGRSALHLAVDQQNLALVRLLLRDGADPNHLTYGGYSALHLTYGRHDDNIRKELHPLTDPALRELPDSESEDSEEEEEDDDDDDGRKTDDEVRYDDIQWNGH